MRRSDMKNERTPRTLADCEFKIGYRQSRLEKTADVLFAVLIGVVLAVLLAYHL